MPINLLRLLKSCRNSKDLKPLKSLFVTQGLIENEFLLEEFVRCCFALGAPGLALSAFLKLQSPSLVVQNLMVRGLNNYGLYEDVLYVYMNCRVLGCPSDNFTFPFPIKACSALGAFRIGKEIHCIVLRTGYERNVVIQTALIDFYAKIGRVGNARVLIDRIPKPDLVSWNALMAGYALNGLDREAFEVFRKIKVMGFKPNVSTLASGIPVCTRLGSFLVGKSLHGLAVKCGYLSNDFLVPALISLYASESDLFTARILFDSLVERHVVVWNAMINAYTQNIKFYETFEMFRQMLRAAVQPNSVTFVSVIPSFEIYSSNGYGEALHACVIKHGSGNQLSALTALISMYAKVGDINSAKVLFSEMPNKNCLLSWNAMISGYVNNGLWAASLVAFQEMQLTGLIPDAVSVVSILSACSRLEDVFLGKSVHAFIVRRDMETNLNVSNVLLAFYSDCNQLSSSFKLFHRMATTNVVSWNTLISGCIHSGQVEKAATLLQQMQKEGMKLDSVTLISVLPSCTEIENLRQGMAIHGYGIRSGFEYNISLINALINMYCNCGDLDSGRSLFEVMPKRSLASWNSLMTGYRHHNLYSHVLVLFALMFDEGQRPNHISLLNLLPVCSTQLQGKSIHAFVVRTGILEETTVLTSLILMYARFGRIDLCLVLFQMAEKRDISLWNTIMSVHIHSKNAKRAVGFFCELLPKGFEPDYITVMSLISASVQVNSLSLSNSVLAYVIRKGFDKELAVSNALIDLYARCGKIFIAEKLFECFLEKDAVSWSVLINGYGLHGDGEAALEVFSRMQRSGVRPNAVTYASLLSACSHAGLIEQGQMIFDSMVEEGICPRTEHYACMVDLLGRTGHLDEAYAFVKKLPFKPSVGMLESLLGACKNHCNVELGEKIFRMLLGIHPENSESYVMLHGIYAAAGRWTDAGIVRSNMEGRGLKKAPGFSLLIQDKD